MRQFPEMTPEEQKAFDEAVDREYSIIAECEKMMAKGGGGVVEIPAEYQGKLLEAREARRKISAAVDDRYISSISDSVDTITLSLDHALSECSKKEFESYIAPRRSEIDEVIQGIADDLRHAKETGDKTREKYCTEQLESFTAYRDEHYKYNFDCAKRWIEMYVYLERDAYIRKGFGRLEIYTKKVDAVALSWYKPKTRKKKPLETRNMEAAQMVLPLFDGAYTTMYRNPAFENLVPLSTRGLTPDKMKGGAATVSRGNHKYTIAAYDKLPGELGVSAKKLIHVAIAELTQQNSYHTAPEKVNPVITLDLIAYARANKMDVDVHPQDTQEEADKEDKRVQANVKELKKSLRHDIEYISSISYSQVDRKSEDFRISRLFSSGEVRGYVIRINFDPQAAEVLVNHSVLSHHSPRLLAIDNKHPNSYAIGCAIEEHYFIDHNLEAGTANTLTVHTLIDRSPDIATVSEYTAKGRRDWKERIKQRVEDALDEAVSVNLITRWEYRTKNDDVLSREEAAALTLEEYDSLRVDYIMADAPDQTARLKAKADRKKAAAEKAENKKGKTSRRKSKDV